ncbi:hypothetical protein [Marinomonas spartinae]|uniref:hypothetical protein n=1 Tax=Marinomonas spartinae TaxID=1792290 RepID=UPI0018F1758B|nr:hypothetical protein [Marinomonas spartinae]MBJ7556547.1 hypothetical protein [Marinomonas spartinae]
MTDLTGILTPHEEQRKQLLNWMFLCPKNTELEAHLSASYHAMNPQKEVVHARHTTDTDTTVNQYEIVLFNEGMPDV